MSLNERDNGAIGAGGGTAANVFARFTLASAWWSACKAPQPFYFFQPLPHEEITINDAIRENGVLTGVAGATMAAYLSEKGWFRCVPLPGDPVSVGVVAEKEYPYRDGRGMPCIFQSEVKKNVRIEDHVAPGRQTGPYWVTGDFSYRSCCCASNGLILVGDAFAFLDPVFSSGVFLGLRDFEPLAHGGPTAEA